MSGFGFLSRKSTMRFDSSQDISQDDLGLETDITEEELQAVEATPSNIVEVSEYVVYSATYQVPAFYFAMHDTSGHLSRFLLHVS